MIKLTLILSLLLCCSTWQVKTISKQVIFGNPEKFASQSATHYSSLNVDADDEFSSAESDAVDVNCSDSDYLSSYTATLPRLQDPSALFMIHFNHIHWYHIVIGNF